MLFIEKLVSYFIDMFYEVQNKYYYSACMKFEHMKLDARFFARRQKHKFDNFLRPYIFAVEALFCNPKKVVNKVLMHIEIDSETYLQVYEVKSMSIDRALKEISKDIVSNENNLFSRSYPTPFFVELLHDDHVLAASTVKCGEFEWDEVDEVPAVEVNLNWGFSF